MTTLSELAAGIATLAKYADNSTALRQAIVRVATEHLGLTRVRLQDETFPASPRITRLPMGGGYWLAFEEASAGSEDVAAVYTAAAGGLLQQAIKSEQAARDLQNVISKLDQLKRDLDSASRSDCIAAERLRIAQELHDRAAQTLFGLGLTTDWLLAHTDHAEIQPDLERLKQLAATGLGQLRDTIFALSTAPVEPGQFKTAVRHLLKDLDAAGITGDFHVWGDVHGLPAELTDALYQVVREALVNVRKHSRASSVLVSVRVQPDAVITVVQDDGLGLTPEVVDTFRKNGAHLGLRGIESRAERFGGKLSLAPGDECGLIVTVTIPLEGAHLHA